MDTDFPISASDAVLALHVLAWAVWLGVAVAIAVLGTRVRARGDASAIVAFVADAGFVGLTVVLPAALVVVVSGGWLAVDADLEFGGDPWWLPACMSLWLVAMLSATALRPQQALKTTALAKEHGAEEEDVQWRARRVLLLARGEALLVAVALVLFVLRPG